MANKDLEFLKKMQKELLKTKESAPIPRKEPVEIVYEPEPDIKLVINNTKKGLL